MSKNKSGLPDYRSLVSLIPGGTMQFLDLGFDLLKIKRLKTEYYEYQSQDGSDQWSLRCITRSDEGDFYLDCQTNAPVLDPITGLPDFNVSPSYSITADKALEPFLDQWVPLPFFRSEAHLGSFELRHRHGPTDWARVKVIALEKPDAAGHSHRVVIAFDTHVQPGIDVANADPSEGYPALSESDMREGAEFMLFSSIKNNSWFIGLDWVSEWLKDLFFQLLQKKRPNRVIRDSDLPNQTEYLGRYIAFLELLAATGEVPRVRLVDPAKHLPIDVDLVLDIGNSRTIGMLIEKRPNENLSLNNGSTLELRDLSSPTVMHRNTFNSYVCFAQAQFGESSYARGAGRIKSSFTWPSVVRVGSEANRLAVSSRREEGETSMSSPKRYLWDLKPRVQEWRYAPDPSDPNAEELPVNAGAFVGFVNNEGFPVHAFDQPRFSPADGVVKNNPSAVTEPRFSRSSLMMFLLSEILSHALVQINSPAQRGDRPTPDIPRRLRRIILTVPPAMSVTERRIFKRWATWAVDVLWSALEWTDFAQNTSDYRLKPEIKVNLDEASATQLVFIYNEVAEKFAGDSASYFKVFGKVRKSYNDAPSLRVASIDIGGGTTDMVVTTYLNESAGPTNIIVPRQDFREGFNFAGDDILRVVIENHVMPELVKFCAESEVRNAHVDIARKFQDAVGVSQKERNLRAQFAQQVLVPIGLKVLHLMEAIPVEDLDASICGISYEDVFSSQTQPSELVLKFLTEGLLLDPTKNFSFNRWTFNIEMSAVGRSISAAIGPYLRDLSEIIKLWDCDYLVLSGRPSCLPVIHSIFRKTPPVEPSRIIPMCDYPIENWYPFWTPEGKIDDPKTTGVVGAMLSAISEGNLMNFHFRTGDLMPASTIKFIGPMGINKQIRNSDLFFSGQNLDELKDEDLSGEFEFAAPVYIGFRQIKAERWKTTPFYFVSFSSTEAIERSNRHGVPYRIQFTYQRRFDDDSSNLERSENEGVLRIQDIVARDGTSVLRTDIDLQLKSLWEEVGHWLDTGLFDVH
jgi:hypothetical protein